MHALQVNLFNYEREHTERTYGLLGTPFPREGNEDGKNIQELCISNAVIGMDEVQAAQGKRAAITIDMMHK